MKPIVLDDMKFHREGGDQIKSELGRRSVEVSMIKLSKKVGLI